MSSQLSAIVDKYGGRVTTHDGHDAYTINVLKQAGGGMSMQEYLDTISGGGKKEKDYSVSDFMAKLKGKGDEIASQLITSSKAVEGLENTYKGLEGQEEQTGGSVITPEQLINFMKGGTLV